MYAFQFQQRNVVAINHLFVAWVQWTVTPNNIQKAASPWNPYAAYTEDYVKSYFKRKTSYVKRCNVQQRGKQCYVKNWNSACYAKSLNVLQTSVAAEERAKICELIVNVCSASARVCERLYVQNNNDIFPFCKYERFINLLWIFSPVLDEDFSAFIFQFAFCLIRRTRASACECKCKLQITPSLYDMCS